ncbi:MAG: enoyl-CoA hydratase/isomerase family protein [Acidimicrobiales bacterium]
MPETGAPSGFRTERRGDTLLVVLDRSDQLNAFDWNMRLGLEELWGAVATDASLGCIIVTGAGRAFCSGADVGDLGAERRAHGQSVMEELAFLPGDRVEIPVIAAVNGVCAGGGLHFVADADMVVAAASAYFVDPHVALGQVSGIEPVSLALHVSMETLSRLCLLGGAGRIDAAMAQRLGLVGEVVDDKLLMDRAWELAGAVTSASPAAVRRTRSVLRSIRRDVLLPAMERGWTQVQAHWVHPDALEGPRARAEGRPPRWEL